MTFRKSWNISIIIWSHSRSSITKLKNWNGLGIARTRHIRQVLKWCYSQLENFLCAKEMKTSYEHVVECLWNKRNSLIWHIKYRHLIIIIRSIWCCYPCDLTYAGNSWHFDTTISMLQDLICDQCFHERWKCNFCWHIWLLFHLWQIRLSLLKDRMKGEDYECLARLAIPDKFLEYWYWETFESELLEYWFRSSNSLLWKESENLSRIDSFVE